MTGIVKNDPTANKINHFRVDVRTMVSHYAQVICATSMNKEEFEEFLDEDTEGVILAEDISNYGNPPTRDCILGWYSDKESYDFEVLEDAVSPEEYEEDGYWVEPDRPRRQKVVFHKEGPHGIQQVS